MAIIRTLDILLRGNTSKLDPDLAKGKQKLGRFGQEIKTLFVGLFAGVSVGGFVAGLRGAATELDNISKTARRLQLPTQDLIALKHATELAGFTLEQYTRTNDRLLRSMFDARRGMQSAQEAFKTLGLSVDTLAQTNQLKRLEMLSAAFSRINDPVTRAGIAMQLFGRQGAEMLRFFDEVVPAITDASDEANRFGFSFSDAQLQPVEDAVDSFELIGKTIRGVFSAIMINLAPALRFMGQVLSSLLSPGSAIRSMFMGIGDALKILAWVVNLALLGLTTISHIFGNLTGVVFRALAMFLTMIAAFKVLRTVTIALVNVKKTLLLIEAGLAALGGLTWAQIGGAVAAMALVGGGLLAWEANLAAAGDKVMDINNEMFKLVGLNDQLGGGKLNVESATFGSQQALETLFKVKMDSPMQQMVGLQQDANQILGEIRDLAKQGNDVVFDFDQVDAF